MALGKRAEYLGPERRRPLVLDAAEEIFAEGGFADASMAAIAARAGVSKAVLYDCFPGGKQEIYLAMLDRGGEIFLEHMLEVLEETSKLPLDEALRRGLNAFLSYAHAHPRMFRILFAEPGTADEELAKRAAVTRECVIAAMSERSRDFMQRAGLQVTPLAQIYDRSVVAIAEELVRWTLNDPDLPRDQAVEAVVVWLMKGFEKILPPASRARPER